MVAIEFIHCIINQTQKFNNLYEIVTFYGRNRVYACFIVLIMVENKLYTY